MDRSYRCAVNRMLYPPESICYRNSSFPDEKIMFPEIYDFNFSISAMKPSEFVRLYEFSCNGTTYDLESHSPKNDLYHLIDIGWIYVNKSIDGGTGYWLNTNDYCLTSYVTENGTRIVVTVCRSLVYLANRIKFMIDLIGLSISIPFLVATFFVYTILPELRHLHGSIFRCYIASIFAFNLLYAMDFAGAHCTCIYYIVIVTHFSILSTFFWMHVLCFGIWWTFRRFRSAQDSSKQGTRKKFIFYSIYACSFPALLTGVGTIIDFVPAVPEAVIGTGLHSNTCSMPDTVELGIYFFDPIVVTIISNICFFVLKAIMINRHEKDTVHRLQGSEDGRHYDEKHTEKKLHS